MRLRGGQRRARGGEHANGFAGDRVGGFGATPRDDRPVLDRRAREGAAEAALLRIAHGELGIGCEQEERLLVTLEVMVNIRHARLLIAADERTEGVAGRYAGVQEIGAGIQGENRRALVVDHAAAEKPAVATLHLIGVGGPAGSRGHHIDMRDGGKLTGTLAGNIGESDVSLIVTRLIPQALGDREAAVERIANSAAERGARFCSRGIGDGRMRNQGGNVRNDILPHLIDVLLDALHHTSAHGRPLPSQ